MEEHGSVQACRFVESSVNLSEHAYALLNMRVRNLFDMRTRTSFIKYARILLRHGSISEPANFLRRMLDENEGLWKDRF